MQTKECVRSLGARTFPSVALNSSRLSRLELIVAHPVKGKLADKVLIELIEADVDIGFGLVDEAKAFRVAGETEMRSRVLHDLAEIVADIECRLQRLGDSGSVPFRPLVNELRDEIAAAKQEAS